MPLLPLARAASLAALLVVSVEASAETPSAPVRLAPDVSTFTLTNGLQVVVIPDRRTPAVTHMIWYRAGAGEDPPGKSGIAHFLEHLMFKGTRSHPAGEYEAKIAAVGGNQNASTSNDYTEYHQTVPRDQLRMVMDYEADRMTNVNITEDVIAAEREVIIEERRMRVDNDPGSQLGEAVTAALFQNSHSGIPIIGWPQEMAGLDRADALAFYDRYYAPNNAVVVVAGDVTPDEVKAAAEETYGRIPIREGLKPRTRTSEPVPLAARTVTMSDARVTQPSLRRSYLVPSYTTAAPGEAEALDVLAEIVGGGATSRLYKTLVVGDHAIAAAAGAGYRSTALEDSVFGFYGVPRGDTTLPEFEAAMDGVIGELLRNGVTDEEVARARRRLVAGAIYAQDSQSSLARVFGEALMTGQRVEAVQDWPSAIEKVTTAEVNAAARKYLDPRRSVTGYLTGKPAEDRS
jgi:zinc protease